MLCSGEFVASLSQIPPIGPVLPTVPTYKWSAVYNLALESLHGMEEVIGSIPIRSTSYFNNLAEPPPTIWQQFGSKSQFVICRRSASFLPTPF